MQTCISGDRKFICDFMLGRLARWLRLFGYDTAYHRMENDLSMIHRARKEGRIILTRSKEKSNYKNAVLILSEDINEQLEQIKDLIRDGEPFSRCPECNEIIRSVDREEVKGRVPEYIFEEHDDFKKCPGCKRIYWKGTHYREIRRKINEIKK